MGKCDAPVECYSRVVGYFRPVTNWNKGKRAEFRDRVMFDIGGISECPTPTDLTVRPSGDVEGVAE